MGAIGPPLLPSAAIVLPKRQSASSLDSRPALPFLILGANGHHGTRRSSDDRVRDASEQQLRYGAPAGRTHHDEIDGVFLGVLHDLGSRLPVDELAADFRCDARGREPVLEMLIVTSATIL